MTTIVIVEGNRHEFIATFKVPDDAGALTDPTTVTFYRKNFASSAAPEQWVYGTDVEVIKESQGVYSITLDFADAGSFAVGAQGTGTCYAYEEWRVEVQRAAAKHP